MDWLDAPVKKQYLNEVWNCVLANAEILVGLLKSGVIKNG